MTEAQLITNDNTLQFYDVDKLFFPKACLVCGTKTDNKIQKTIIGSFTYTKDKRKDYYLELPICNDCSKNIKIKKGKEISKVIVFSIIGLIIGLILYFLTTSIFIAIASVTFSFMIPFMLYRSKVGKKINLEKYIQLKSMSFSKDLPEEILEMKLFSENYTKHLSKLNLEKNSELKKVKEFSPKKISMEIKSERPSGIVCQKCNATIASGMSFCTQCGTKIESKLNEESTTISKVSLSPIPMKESREKILEKIPEPKVNTIDSSDFIETKKFSLDSLKQLKNDIDYVVKPSLSNDSPQTSRALTLANASLKAVESGNEDKALKLMEASLKMGLKEPEYNKIKHIALGIIKKKLEEINKEEKKTEESLEKDTLICPHCKNSLPSDSLFCVSCGKSIKSIKSVQNDTKPEVKPLIPKPEKANNIECRNCGHSNESNLNFCTNCGSKL